MGTEPEVLSATARLCELGSDTQVEAEFRFPGGIPATLFADIQDGPFRGLLHIEAENGTVELDNPCLPHTGHSFRENLDGTFCEYTVAGGTTYDYQLAAFLAAVDSGDPIATGGADAIGNMAALEAIYERAGVRRALTPA